MSAGAKVPFSFPHPQPCDRDRAASSSRLAGWTGVAVAQLTSIPRGARRHSRQSDDRKRQIAGRGCSARQQTRLAAWSALRASLPTRMRRP